ncbi:polysaccharide deacetylase family protein [Amycolatopsis jejuensis]|uniref:polysaccharide deacetylase family protein n=1 Tax=Amycolatopsis jejuensis TaxID=330084 RepID=UPI0009FD4ED9|nr:polysaccharide deacetylase family protein [Amycolatopsis jejuensis]
MAGKFGTRSNVLENPVKRVAVSTGRVVNLTVHGIGKPPRELEPGEDHTWVRADQFERVLDAVVERPDVRLTFDDGNASDVEIALPKLIERGLTAEFFLLAGRVGEKGRIDADGIDALLGSGMSVGSHGWAHRDWRRLGGQHVEQEFRIAPRVLARHAGVPVRRVAVPFGSYDRRVLAALRASGVQRVYTSDGGAARGDSWLQPRTSLRHDLDDAWIDDVLAGAPGIRRRARRTVAKFVKQWRG